MSKDKMTKKLTAIQNNHGVNSKNTSFISDDEKSKITKKMHEGKLQFSFFHLDTDDEYFNCGGRDTPWFMSFIDNLKNISKLNKSEFFEQRQHYDVHSIEWGKCTRSSFKISEEVIKQLSEDKPMQFRISQSEGRIHGFMIENTFFVVWLDPEHNLWLIDGYGGVKQFAYPLRPYELILNYNQELQDQLRLKEIENYELMQMLDEYTKAQ
jgi:hypothetical protein